jgi:hypothetical protein
MTTQTTSQVAPLSLRADLRRSGPALLIGAAITALGVTALAAFLDPSLATAGHADYLLSGVVMTFVDLATALGLTALALAGATRPGRFSTFAFGLVVIGSFAIIPAEILLRVDFGLGTALFDIVGPIQAVGLILAGIAIVRAGQWHSWRRAIVLVFGLYIPLVMVPLSASAQTSLGLAALAGYHSLVLLVGLAFSQELGRIDA